MKITIHVASVEGVQAARDSAEAAMQPGDELEIIVAQSMNVETQPARPAGGVPAGQKRG